MAARVASGGVEAGGRGRHLTTLHQRPPAGRVVLGALQRLQPGVEAKGRVRVHLAHRRRAGGATLGVAALAVPSRDALQTALRLAADL